jgi:4-hydroxybenzoate polyprenyltransferase
MFENMTAITDNLAFNKQNNMVAIFFSEFIRIRGVLGWLAIASIGFVLGMSPLPLSSYLIPVSVFLVSTFCMISFTFSINNLYDIDSDRRNHKKIHFNAMASGKISTETGTILNIILVIIPPLAVALLFNPRVFIFCLLLIFWMWAYSSPPLRLKGRPGADILWHFAAFVLLVLWGSSIAGSLGLISWLVAVSIGVFSCIAQVLNHINDYQFDRESGTVTYAVWRGLDSTVAALKTIILLHCILLIPLIFLYSLSYSYTIGILIAGILTGIFVVETRKHALGSSAYYFPVVLGFAVYVNCIIFQISVLIGEPTIGLRFLT